MLTKFDVIICDIWSTSFVMTEIMYEGDNNNEAVSSADRSVSGSGCRSGVVEVVEVEVLGVVVGLDDDDDDDDGGTVVFES